MYATMFSAVYQAFFNKVTDDMYMEMTREDTEGLVEDLMMAALPWFEFPRVDIFDYDEDLKAFNVDLSREEINIIATYMVSEWIGQQLAIIDNVRMKYSGSDFKFTSQANHIAKLINLKKEYERQGFHLQRLYKRRKRGEDGVIRSTMGLIMGYEQAVQKYEPAPEEVIEGGGAESNTKHDEKVQYGGGANEL